MKRDNIKLSEQQKAELDALRDMPEEDIDYSDIPETLHWPKARRGAFYEPVMRETTLTLDEYVIDWFKNNTPDGQDYHETVNQALLDHIQRLRFPPHKASMPR